MLVRLLYFVVCESSAVDAESNKVSIFNLWEAIEVRKREIPAGSLVQILWPDFQCVTCWHRESDAPIIECEQTIVLTDPDGEELLRFPNKFDLTGKRHRNFLRFSGFHMPHPPHPKMGSYEFRLFLRMPDSDEEKMVAKYPIDFELKEGDTKGVTAET